MADLCCDHAHLAAQLCAQGRVPWAIAGDLNPGPLEAAAVVLARLGVEDRVELRRGSGLEVLSGAPEPATICIAGVGALLAATLLETGADLGLLDSERGVTRLVIQANDGFPRLGTLRARLDALGWGLVHEQLVLDRARVYTILVAERGGLGLRDPLDAALGPILRRGLDPLFPHWRALELARIERALAGMDAAAIRPAERANYSQWQTDLEALG